MLSHSIKLSLPFFVVVIQIFLKTKEKKSPFYKAGKKTEVDPFLKVIQQLAENQGLGSLPPQATEFCVLARPAGGLTA